LGDSTRNVPFKKEKKTMVVTFGAERARFLYKTVMSSMGKFLQIQRADVEEKERGGGRTKNKGNKGVNGEGRKKDKNDARRETYSLIPRP